MAIEEFEMPRGRLGANGGVWIQLLQGRRDGVGKPDVLHPARIPGRLQEERAPEDPQERAHRDAAHVVGEGRFHQRIPRAAMTAAMATAADTAAMAAARSSRMARMAHAAATA